MIGIVVVSHSHALATAAVELAREMTAEPPAIAVAAGLDEATFGTDAAAISEAITAVDSPDGVLVLLDLGSAILSTEMALEFVDPEVADRVRISPAPLVEGLVAAVVTASSGASLDEVAAEATAGLEAKRSHLAPADDPPVDANPSIVVDQPPADSVAWRTTINNAHGLHARPAAAFVGALRGLDVRARASNASSGAGPVPAGSISKVATLGLLKGHELVVELWGPDAGVARRALQELADSDFGEAAEPTTPTTTPDAPTSGMTASGTQVVLAPAHVAAPQADPDEHVPGPDEAGRLGTVRRELAEHLRAGDEILRMQADLLEDPELVAQLDAELAATGNAAQALDRVLTSAAEEFAALPDPYQAERAQDLRSLRRQLLRRLLDLPEDVSPSSDHVLVLPELDASTAARLDPTFTVGVVTTTGGSTGHGVIIATGRGIPVLTGRSEAAGLAEGTILALDPLTGELWLAPDEQTVAEISTRAEERERAEAQALQQSGEPALTRSGRRIMVEANVGSLEDARRAAEAGAEGSGLVRTELLFGHLRVAPSAEEQAAVLVEVGQALAGHPMTIRTWDVGGDKPLPYLAQEPELNPFLGERGLRTMRRVPEFFDEQLRAVALASKQVAVRLMFPMVTEPEEMEWARARALAAIEAVDAAPFPIGMMVEVPAAALRAAEFRGLADFVSIGTNDLTQYTTATDRSNGAVSHLARSDSAGVLALMRMTCEQLPGIPVAVCGDLASKPDLTATLVGMGVTELSVRPPLVGQVKMAVRAAD